MNGSILGSFLAIAEQKALAAGEIWQHRLGGGPSRFILQLPFPAASSGSGSDLGVCRVYVSFHQLKLYRTSSLRVLGQFYRGDACFIGRSECFKLSVLCLVRVYLRTGLDHLFCLGETGCSPVVWDLLELDIKSSHR